MLYCFFVIAHDRRRILHCNVTKHPTSLWVVQQLREAFPLGSAPRFLIFDRDGKYGVEVPASVRSLGTEAIQNLVRESLAERRGGTVDRKLSARPVGPCHCCERTPSEETSFRLHLLLPGGPHASRTREGNSGGEDLFRKRRARYFSR